MKRAVILDAIREHKPGVVLPKLEKASKAELVARTKRIFKGSTWLPESVAHPLGLCPITDGSDRR